MGSSNIRDILTAFSPSSDFLAITSGAGRIKIWDTLKGQVQTEFTDLTSTNTTDLYAKPEHGHLSLDYSCIKWLPLEKKKKKKFATSLLVLGTASGDVVALDVSAGALKWRVTDCHPGGVNAITSSTHSSCIYTAGVDGMVSQIDYMTGNLSGKFRASTKAISSLAISSDGKMLATAAGQLKIFSCSDNRKMQKFSGHPGGVRCMIFTEDGNYVLSSATGERYIVVWKIEGAKKQSASCVLAMEHPAVFLHSKCAANEETDDMGLYVLAISELGLCYFWYGKSIDELRNSKPTKISFPPYPSMNNKGALVFAAEIQGIVKPGSGKVLVAHGSLVKPSFEKIIVHYGEDIMLNSVKEGVLLPMGQMHMPQKGQFVHAEVTALDRANVEDALLPLPKLHDSHRKKRRHTHSSIDPEDVMANEDTDNRNQAMPMDTKDEKEDDVVVTGMEERLRLEGILFTEEELNKESYPQLLNKLSLSSTMLDKSHNEASMPLKKIKSAIKSMTSTDANKLLTVLVGVWKSRSGSGKHVLPWIFNILVYHGHYIISQETSDEMLESLCEMTESKCLAVKPLLQLVGRIQLIIAQIDKGDKKSTKTISHNDQFDASESEDDDADELVYGEEDESISGSDDDN